MPHPRKTDPVKCCERCGSVFTRTRYGKTLEDRTRFLKRQFCSLHCANSRGIRGQSFTQQHQISAEFAKPQCESCGGTGHLHVHHKNEDWKDHRLENLVTLCIRCHLHGAHKKPPKPCSVCGEKSRKHGMCQKHFQRWKKYGDASLTKVRKAGSREYELVCESPK